MAADLQLHATLLAITVTCHKATCQALLLPHADDSEYYKMQLHALHTHATCHMLHATCYMPHVTYIATCHTAIIYMATRYTLATLMMLMPHVANATLPHATCHDATFRYVTCHTADRPTCNIAKRHMLAPYAGYAVTPPYVPHANATCKHATACHMLHAAMMLLM
jgi:hypothetical protein